MIKRVLLAMVALILVASACGDDDSTETTAVATSAAESTTTTAPAPLELTVVLPWPANPPVCCMMEEVADALGYYERAGVDVTFEKAAGSAAVMQVLVAGRADLASFGYITAGVGAYLEGADDIRMIGGALNQNYDRSDIGWYFATTTDVNTPADLKGKVIGLVSGPDPTDPGYVQVSSLLESAGLTDDDVTWAVIGTQSDRAAALIAGRVDVTTISIELAYLVDEDPNLHNIIFDPEGAWTGWQGCACWWTRTGTIADAEKAEALDRYLTATVQATRDLASDRALFEQAMGLFMDMEGQTEGGIDFVWNWLRQQYQVNGGMNLQDMQAWFDNVYLTRVNPDAAGSLTLSDFVDPSLMKAVIDKLGAVDFVTQDPPQFEFSS